MKQDYIFRKLEYHGNSISRANKIYDEIRTLLNNGTLDYKVRQLKYIDEELLQDSKSITWNQAFDSETDTHELLKGYAATYLSELGQKPVFEQRCWFGIADIGTENQTEFAEIGKVDLDKLLKAFGYATNHQFFGQEYERYDSADRLLILPYSINNSAPPARAIDLFKK